MQQIVVAKNKISWNEETKDDMNPYKFRPEYKLELYNKRIENEQEEEESL